MVAYFLDTSALVKHYVAETGTAWVNGLMDPAAGHVVYLVRITGVELIAAIARRRKNGTIAPADAPLVMAEIRREFGARFFLVEITSALVGNAMDLADTYALRGYDAVQLSAARDIHRRAPATAPLTLISADAELNAAAFAEGLTVDDPNTHP